jgi:hypothetical protein
LGFSRLGLTALRSSGRFYAPFNIITTEKCISWLLQQIPIVRIALEMSDITSNRFYFENTSAIPATD